MPRVALSLRLLALLASSASAVQYSPHGQGCVDASTQSLPFCDPRLPRAARVADLVGRLTLDEKIGLTGSAYGDMCSDIDAGVPRLRIPNVTQLIEVTGTVSSSCYVDAAGVSFCPTVFPAPLTLAASFSRRLMRLKGAVTGAEARAFNNLHVSRIYSADNFVDLLAFGPDINLILDPRNGRNGENPTEDPLLGGVYAEEVTRGMQEGEDPNYLQLASMLKHYAGYERETNRFASNDNITNFDLLDTLLPPYGRGLQRGRSSGTMCSYNSLNGVPSCADSWLLTSMVREFWGRPDATHTSDCGAVESEFTAKGWATSIADATARSMTAGTDSCIGTAFIGGGGLAAAIANGTLALAALDAALTRTLSVRFALGMFDAPNATIYTQYGPEKIGEAGARAAAAAAAAQGAVLLRNVGGALPLRAASPALRTVAVVGPHAVSQRDLLGDFYGDAFCPGVSNRTTRAADCVTTLGAAVAEYLATPRPDVEVVIAAGTNVAGTDAGGLPAAVAAAAAADVVILAVGYNNADIEREGADHNFTTLPGLQANLTDAVVAAAAARGAPVVMLLINAGQIALDTLAAQPPAIVEAFYPAFGARALVAQLFGDTNSWGRLPYTIYPAAYASAINLSSFNISTGVGRTYRYYAGAAGPVNYAFGDGLSYSAFATTCSSAGPTTVAANANFSLPIACATGLAPGETRAGDEILLAYHRAGDDIRRAVGARHPVPAKTLRDFARLDGLAPGAPAAGSDFAITPMDLALVNEAGASLLWPGTHYVDVAPRPPAAPWTLAVTVTGAQPVTLSAPPPLPKAA